MKMATPEKEKKPTMADYIRYIIGTPIDKIIEELDPHYKWVGETEADRARAMTRFVRLRGIMQKAQQAISGDDVDLLIKLLREYIVPVDPIPE